jgi:hypothetical protein
MFLKRISYLRIDFIESGDEEEFDKSVLKDDEDIGILGLRYGIRKNILVVYHNQQYNYYPLQRIRKITIAI